MADASSALRAPQPRAHGSTTRERRSGWSQGTAKRLVASVAGRELAGGKLACPLTITFTNGSRWEFDVPRGGKSAAERVVSLLAA